MPQDLFSSPRALPRSPPGGSTHLRIIEDETSVLGDQDVATADKHLAEAAAGMTFGELRSAAHKLVLKLDPEAARPDLAHPSRAHPHDDAHRILGLVRSLPAG